MRNRFRLLKTEHSGTQLTGCGSPRFLSLSAVQHLFRTAYHTNFLHFSGTQHSQMFGQYRNLLSLGRKLSMPIWICTVQRMWTSIQVDLPAVGSTVLQQVFPIGLKIPQYIVLRGLPWYLLSMLHWSNACITVHLFLIIVGTVAWSTGANSEIALAHNQQSFQNRMSSPSRRI